MFADQVIAFSGNLENLRDFIDMVSAFLQEKAQKEFEDNAADLGAFFWRF